MDAGKGLLVSGWDATATDARTIGLSRSPPILVFLTNSLDDILAAGAAQPKGPRQPCHQQESVDFLLQYLSKLTVEVPK